MDNKNKTVIFITGPTAVGKTKYAIEVAKAFDGEIISADSMQIYQYMNIGSAKPTNEELSMVKHHLIGEIDPKTEFSVAEYQTRAKGYIKQVFSSGKLPIVSGGTGLYINSLIYDMDFSVMPRQAGFREELENDAALYGVLYVHDILKSLDMPAAQRIHPNNLKKVIRAIEVVKSTGDGIKEFKESFTQTTDYDILLIGLSRNREELYARIDERVEQLMDAGLVSEIEFLLAQGLSEKHISMNGIGYKELISYLHGEYDLAEAVRLIKRNSRHYAKRQMTWLNRYSNMNWFNLSEFKTEEAALSAIFDLITQRRT